MALFITFNSPNSVFASNLFLTFSVSYCDMGSVRSASISSRKAASAASGATPGSNCPVKTNNPGSRSPVT